MVSVLGMVRYLEYWERFMNCRVSAVRRAFLSVIFYARAASDLAPPLWNGRLMKKGFET